MMFMNVDKKILRPSVFPCKLEICTRTYWEPASMQG